MVDNSALLSRLYEIYRESEPEKLGPLMGLTPNTIRRWKDGTFSPGKATLLQILTEKKEDLRPLIPRPTIRLIESHQQLAQSVLFPGEATRSDRPKRINPAQEDWMPFIQTVARLYRLSKEGDWQRIRDANIYTAGLLAMADLELGEDWNIEALAGIKNLVKLLNSKKRALERQLRGQKKPTEEGK